MVDAKIVPASNGTRYRCRVAPGKRFGLFLQYPCGYM